MSIEVFGLLSQCSKSAAKKQGGTMFIKTDLKYGNGIEINEFRGRISLIAATEKNGKVYQKWGDVEIGKDNKKRLPVASI
jgi:hypothetical protein